MKKTNHNATAAFLMIITYILVQFLPVIFTFIVPGSISLYISMAFFIVGAITMFILERVFKMTFSFEKSYRNNARQIWKWGLLGLPLSLLAQYAAQIIELILFGPSPVSLNTTVILEVIRQFPIFILFVSIAGPIMEEFVFRKAIGGFLVNKIGWIGASVISSLIFAFIHLDGNYLIYGAMGLLFSYLYYKTNNLLAPIIAHVLMNTFVVVLYLFVL